MTELRELVLAFVIIFNKRRSGEVAKVKTEEWNDRHKWKDQTNEDMERLTELEKKLVNTHELIYIVGKCRKYVPIIFPLLTTRAINRIVQNCRNDEYLFQNKGEGYIRGSDAMRNVIQYCGCLNCPERITSTSLRKLTATSFRAGKL
jgi:hypothetical protein